MHLRTFTRSSPDQAESLGLLHSYSLSSDPRAPIVYMIHGRAGELEIMHIFRRCVPPEFSIVHVQAPLPDPIGGFSWWNVGEGVSAGVVIPAAQTVANFVESFPGQHRLTPVASIGFGFSQGGAVLSFLGLTEPSLLSGVAILASFVPYEGITLGQPPYPKFFVAHGTRDTTVPIEKSRIGAAYLRSLNIDLSVVEDDVTHKVGTSGMRALSAWTSSFQNGLSQ